MSAVGMVQQSRAEGAVSEANAQQYEQRRTAELAQGTLKAEQTRKEADRLIAKQRAIAAASGGGTFGSAATIMANTAGKGQFQSDMDLWLGQERADAMQYSADVTRAEAKAKRKALPFQIGSAVLSGVSSAYDKAPASWKTSVSPWKTTTEPYRYS
jgi:hypothetical protein